MRLDFQSPVLQKVKPSSKTAALHMSQKKMVFQKRTRYLFHSLSSAESKLPPKYCWSPQRQETLITLGWWHRTGGPSYGSLYKYLLRTYSMSGIVLTAENTLVNKTDKNPCPLKTYTLERAINNEDKRAKYIHRF